jgi:glutaredoxin
MKKQNNYLGQQQLQLQEVVVDKHEKEKKRNIQLVLKRIQNKTKWFENKDSK